MGKAESRRTKAGQKRHGRVNLPVVLHRPRRPADRRSPVDHCHDAKFVQHPERTDNSGFADVHHTVSISQRPKYFMETARCRSATRRAHQGSSARAPGCHAISNTIPVDRKTCVVPRDGPKVWCASSVLGVCNQDSTNASCPE